MKHRIPTRPKTLVNFDLNTAFDPPVSSLFLFPHLRHFPILPLVQCKYLFIYSLIRAYAHRSLLIPNVLSVTNL